MRKLLSAELEGLFALDGTGARPRPVFERQMPLGSISFCLTWHSESSRAAAGRADDHTVSERAHEARGADVLNVLTADAAYLLPARRRSVVALH